MIQSLLNALCGIFIALGADRLLAVPVLEVGEWQRGALSITTAFVMVQIVRDS